MPQKKQSKGTCAFCQSEMAKSAITKHLPACPQRLAAIREAEESSRAPESLYHLRVQAEGLSDFWLDLEMRGSATLKDLDRYLREIWLECCDHLSQFSVGGWGGDEISMKKTAAQVFTPDIELTHIYDFGSQSVTLIRVVSVREGKPLSSRPMVLMSRNQPPDESCIECDQPAAWLCMECMYEEQKSGLLCTEHATDHPHDNYGEPVELVNSPRMGVCGYEGPADPPY